MIITNGAGDENGPEADGVNDDAAVD